MKKTIRLLLTFLLTLLCGCFDDVQKQTYTATFNTDGGTIIPNQTIETGGKVIEPSNPKKDECVFDGWYTSSTFETKFSFSKFINEDITIYAKWKEFDKNVVSFDTVGGNVIESVEVINVLNDEIIPVKKGFTFLGWYLDSEYKTEYKKNILITKDITLYAKWSNPTKDITYLLSEDKLSYYVEVGIDCNEVVIPNTYKDLPITKILDKAFLSFKNVKSITIPSSINEIGNDSFTGCTNLMYIYTTDQNKEKLISLVNGNLKDIILGETDINNLPLDDYFLGMNLDSDINSVEDLTTYLDYAIFNRIESFPVTIKFVVDDFNVMINEAVDNMLIEKNASFKFSMSNNIITVTVTYKDECINSASSENKYVQIDSSCKEFVSTRLDDFNDFKIEKLERTYNVKTTEQLYYVLEKEYRPIINDKTSNAYLIYEEAKKVLREIIDDSMSDIEKLHAIYDYLVLNITYDKDLFNKVLLGEQNLRIYKGFYLEGVFLDKRAVCDGFAKAFVVLSQIEGIECIRVSGKSLTGVGHAWNKVRLDGMWYVIDVTSGNTILNDTNEILLHNRFLINDTLMSRYYIQEDNLDIVAKGSYNIYKDLSYEYEGNTYDLYIESQDELNNFLEYYDTIEEEITIDIKVGFDYGDSLKDELEKAVSVTGVGISRYMLDNDVIVFLK